MANLHIHPRYAEILSRHGLTSAQDFLKIQGIILSGHPERHVLQVALEGSGEGDALGPSSLRTKCFRGYLKKEHRVPWRDRLAHYLGGLGWVSKSRREAMLLDLLQKQGFGCPEVIAVGEENGQAFLLLAEIPQAVELRTYLHEMEDPITRRRLARVLGEELARLHNHGFDHPDLTSKHVLIQEDADFKSWRIFFLDWQRGREWPELPWHRRIANLALLHASLAESLAGPRERLAFLAAYLAKSTLPFRSRLKLAQIILRKGKKFLDNRKIRELALPPLAAGQQNLIWLEGEGLCVTTQFLKEMDGLVPDWLRVAALESDEKIKSQAFVIPGPRRLQLIQRRSFWPFRWLWSLFNRRKLRTAEFLQAATLFRLEKYGVAVPRLLAVGQRFPRPWRTVSFLLTEPHAETISLFEYLKTTWARENFSGRRQALRQTGILLCRLHEAGYSLSRTCPLDLAVKNHSSKLPQIVMNSLEGLKRPRTLFQGRRLADLKALWKFMAPHCTGTDLIRFLNGYWTVSRQDPQARRRVRESARIPSQAPRTTNYEQRIIP